MRNWTPLIFAVALSLGLEWLQVSDKTRYGISIFFLLWWANYIIELILSKQNETHQLLKSYIMDPRGIAEELRNLAEAKREDYDKLYAIGKEIRRLQKPWYKSMSPQDLARLDELKAEQKSQKATIENCWK